MTAVQVHPAKGDGIGRIVLDQPPLNILTRDMLKELRAALTSLATDHTLRVLVMTAEGKHFSAGADVGEHLPPLYEQLIPEFVETIDAVRRFPLPVIAQVRGRCVGGGLELAVAADIVVAESKALFGQPEIVLGVLPPIACVLLPKIVTWGAAAELILSGELVSADEAQRIGIVQYVVASEELQERADQLAQRIARHSAATLRVGKRMMQGDADECTAALHRARDLYTNDLMATKDATEGLRAFLEKREPQWSHR